jgi:hypothetical protein
MKGIRSLQCDDVPSESPAAGDFGWTRLPGAYIMTEASF